MSNQYQNQPNQGYNVAPYQHYPEQYPNFIPGGYYPPQQNAYGYQQPPTHFQQPPMQYRRQSRGSTRMAARGYQPRNESRRQKNRHEGGDLVKRIEEIYVMEQETGRKRHNLFLEMSKRIQNLEEKLGRDQHRCQQDEETNNLIASSLNDKDSSPTSAIELPEVENEENCLDGLKFGSCEATPQRSLSLEDLNEELVASANISKANAIKEKIAKPAVDTPILQQTTPQHRPSPKESNEHLIVSAHSSEANSIKSAEKIVETPILESVNFKEEVPMVAKVPQLAHDAHPSVQNNFVFANEDFPPLVSTFKKDESVRVVVKKPIFTPKLSPKAQEEAVVKDPISSSLEQKAPAKPEKRPVVVQNETVAKKLTFSPKMSPKAQEKAVAAGLTSGSLEAKVSVKPEKAGVVVQSQTVSKKPIISPKLSPNIQGKAVATGSTSGLLKEKVLAKPGKDPVVVPNKTVNGQKANKNSGPSSKKQDQHKPIAQPLKKVPNFPKLFSQGGAQNGSLEPRSKQQEQSKPAAENLAAPKKVPNVPKLFFRDDAKRGSGNSSNVASKVNKNENKKIEKEKKKQEESASSSSKSEKKQSGDSVMIQEQKTAQVVSSPSSEVDVAKDKVLPEKVPNVPKLFSSNGAQNKSNPVGSVETDAKIANNKDEKIAEEGPSSSLQNGSDQNTTNVSTQQSEPYLKASEKKNEPKKQKPKQKMLPPTFFETRSKETGVFFKIRDQIASQSAESDPRLEFDIPFEMVPELVERHMRTEKDAGVEPSGVSNEIPTEQPVKTKEEMASRSPEGFGEMLKETGPMMSQKERDLKMKEEMESILAGYIKKQHEYRCHMLAFEKEDCPQPISKLQGEIVSFAKGVFLAGLETSYKDENVVKALAKVVRKYQQKSKDPQEPKICQVNAHLLSIFFGILLTHRESVIMMDMLYMVEQGGFHEKLGTELEADYLEMIMESESWNLPLEYGDPICVEDTEAAGAHIDIKLRQGFCDHINREYRRRHKLMKEAAPPSSIERLVLEDYELLSVSEKRWPIFSTEKLLRLRRDTLLGQPESEQRNLFIDLFNFLICFKSSILDFDAFLFFMNLHNQNFGISNVLKTDTAFFELVFRYNS